MARFNQELRSPGKFTVLRQVRGEAGKSVCGSGLGPRRWGRETSAPNPAQTGTEALDLSFSGVWAMGLSQGPP